MEARSIGFGNGRSQPSKLAGNAIVSLDEERQRTPFVCGLTTAWTHQNALEIQRLICREVGPRDYTLVPKTPQAFCHALDAGLLWQHGEHYRVPSEPQPPNGVRQVTGAQPCGFCAITAQKYLAGEFL